MYTLFIDTHSELIFLSLFNEEKTFIKQKESFHEHSKLVLPMLKELMNEVNITFKDIESIIVVNGPGSFTGIRIGVSIAKTLGYALDIPVYSISTLTLYLISNEYTTDKMAVIEDNKGYYISVFDKDNNVKVEEKYLDNLDSYRDYKIVDNKIDINKVKEYKKNLKKVNIHLLKANYVKKIGVEL